MKLFHYARVSAYNSIKNGEREAGIANRRRLVPFPLENCDTMCSWHLLEPEPEQWTHNQKSPEVWKDLMGKVGDLLLEVDIDKHINEASVVDFEHVEGWARKVRNNEIPDTDNAEIEAYKHYLASKVPLREYLDKGLKYDLPEVIITADIPPEDVRVHPTQTKIEDRLNRFPGDFSYRRDIARIPELRSFIEKSDDPKLRQALEMEDREAEEFESYLERKR